MRLLDDPEVVRWCYEGITDVTLANTNNKDKLAVSKEIEKKWGNAVMGTSNQKQWTTRLCENLVREALVKLGRKNVRKTKQLKSSLRDKKYNPDLECDEFVYEVKGRSWCTTGTAGEKILGVPLKYGEVPTIYHKPLKIVLVGYQEYEARKSFAFGDLLDSSEQTEELKGALAYHKEHEVEYVGFTEYLTKIGLPNGYWRKLQ